MIVNEILLLAIAFFSFATPYEDIYVAAPNALRLDAEEIVAIFLNKPNDVASQQFDINVADYPGRTKNITHEVVRIKPNAPNIVKIVVASEDLPPSLNRDVNEKLYVLLSVKSENFFKEVVLPLSFQSGYLYLQTDKPIYTPKQDVHFWIIQLNEEGKPTDRKFCFQIRNPGNAVVRETTESSTNLITVPPLYKFPNYPTMGLWSATVLYGHNFQRNTTVHFDLQEYVLPTFTVKVKVPEVILPTTTEITVSIESKYVYGKPVDGIVTVKLGVQGQTPQALFFAVLPPIDLIDGMYTHKINISALKQRPDIGWFPDILGSHLVVEANVSDRASGKVESVVNNTAKFSMSPFDISFKRCRIDFKPGLESLIQVDVKYANGAPASGIRTVISAIADKEFPLNIGSNTAISNSEGKVSFEIQPEIRHKSVEITVKTDDSKYGVNQAVGKFVQRSYESNSNAFLSINSNKLVTEPGETFSEIIDVNPATISDIYYMVISKGKILVFDKLPRGEVSRRKIKIEVSYDMVPSFRVVAFSTHADELIVDSVKVDVAKKCKPEVNVVIEPKFPAKEPGREGKIMITGSKFTRVGLLAVDAAVYALSKQDAITKTKMFQTMDHHDLGCGPGGGLKTNTVLNHAGVILMSRKYSPPDQTAVSACEEKVRKKREAIAKNLDKYKGRLRQCCALGMSQDKYERTCTKRAEIVAKYLHMNNHNCSDVFLECCLNQEDHGMTLMRSRLIGRMGGSEVSHMDFVSEEEEVDLERKADIRSNFMETWIFTEIPIGPDGKEELKINLPHSITTWVIQGVFVNEDHGMCVAEPQFVESFKQIFLQLNLPYSVVKNEQVEIQATVFNYDVISHPVVVYMYGQKDLCSGAQEGEKSERKRIVVEGNSGITVGFPVIPLKQGVFPIKVVALYSASADIVEKKLNVVAEGTEKEKDIIVMLDPSNQRKREKRHTRTNDYSDSIDDSQKLQVTAVKLKAPEEFVPGTESCVITAIGDQFGPTVQTALDDPERLLKMPSGCGEQNMIYFAPTMYTMRYLKSTGRITPEKEAKGFDLVRQGYAHQLKYRNDDNGFAAWKGHVSSTWLTAFVIKVFCQASHMVHIDEDVMCSGIKFLIDAQDKDGSFIERRMVYHTDMMGGVQGKAPLTAYVYLTLHECSCNIPNLSIVKARALSYLEENLGNVNDPLPIAITAYALALGDIEMKTVANSKLLSKSNYDKDLNTLYWGDGKNAHSIETSSYALLTQIQFNDMEKSNSIVNWLNTKQVPSGAFQSTQDTVVALHALSEYSTRARMPGINLVSNITYSNDKHFSKMMAFTEKNALILQQEHINKLGGMLFINTGGHGIGYLGIKLRYNVLTPPEEICKFDISVDVTEAKEVPGDIVSDFDADSKNKDHFMFHPNDLIRGIQGALDASPEESGLLIDPRNRQRGLQIDNEPQLIRPNFGNDRSRMARVKREDKINNSKHVLNVQICLKYLGDKDAGMTIADVGIFSGFKPNVEDIQKLQNDRAHLIQQYEESSRGIVFYLEKGPHQEPYCFNFRVTREYIVGNTQSSVIKVYDYYNPDQACTLFYSPDSNSPIIRKLCSGGVCQCAEGGCPSSDPFPFYEDMDRLELTACEHHDYFWKGKAQGLTKENGFLRITFLVETVFKEGIEKRVEIENDVRYLMARDNCLTSELIKDQVYLIMGKDGELYEDDSGKLWYRYMLDKTTKVHKFTSSKRNRKLERALLRLGKKLKEEGCEL